MQGRSIIVGLIVWLLAAPGGGRLAVAAPPSADADKAEMRTPDKPGENPAARTGFVLAVSWQPAFCETRATLPECIGQGADRVDATQFSLGGLWPVGKRFCGVTPDMRALDRKRDWMALPAVALSPALAARLAVAMPGTASGLDRHEWLRSGTCQTLDAEAYMSLQLRLLDAVNASRVAALFRDTIGGEVTEAEVRAAFEQSFGTGAGERVKLQCRRAGGRLLVTGVTVGLSADVAQTTDLGQAIRMAAPTSPKCEKGIVDRAGASAPAGGTVVGRG